MILIAADTLMAPAIIRIVIIIMESVRAARSKQASRKQALAEKAQVLSHCAKGKNQPRFSFVLGGSTGRR